MTTWNRRCCYSLVDNNKVELGMPVETVTRKMRNHGDERGLIVYGYKFRPAVVV